jgi:cysteine desulfurase
MSSAGRPLYFDNAATTPVDPRVAQAIADCLAAAPGNPSANHAAGRAARARVEEARAHVARLIGAEDPASIVWTSGATESDNLAVLGAARANAGRGRHVVTSKTEHRAVLDACARLEKEGWRVTYLKPDREGLIAPDAVGDALRPDTTLVSVMLVNNETGVVQDVAAIGEVCRARNVTFHVDAAQAAGRVPIDVETIGADLLSLSAHKIHGPAGVGALYVRRYPRPALLPLQFGGGQEGGLRSGTVPLHQVVGMGEAFRLAAEALPMESVRLAALRERLWAGLQSLDAVHLNGHPTQRAPHVLNVSFEGVDGESLLDALPDVAVASGAACSSASGEPSYVLRALGRDDLLAQASLRLSVGRYTTEADVDELVVRVRGAVEHLRASAPGGGAGGPDDRPGWVSAEARDPLTGTHVRWHLRGEGGRVAESRHEVRGCPHTVATAARIAAVLPGQPADALRVSVTGVAAELEVPAEKLGRLFVIEDAVRSAALLLAGSRP